MFARELEHTVLISKDLFNFFKRNEKKEGKLQLLTLYKTPLNLWVECPLSQGRITIERGIVKSLFRVLLSQN